MINRVHWTALNILTKCQNNINESNQIDNDSCTREIDVTKNAWRTAHGVSKYEPPRFPVLQLQPENNNKKVHSYLDIIIFFKNICPFIFL